MHISETKLQKGLSVCTDVQSGLHLEVVHKQQNGIFSHDPNPIKRQEINASENVVC